MASAKDVVATVGSELALSPPTGSGTSYGFLDGLLLQLTPGKNAQGHPQIAVSVRYLDAAHDPGVRQALDTNAELAAAGVRPKRVEVRDGGVVYQQSSPVTGGFAADKLKLMVHALVRTVRNVVPPLTGNCRTCGATDEAGAILVNGTVDCLCVPCLERLRTEADDVQAAYDAIRVRRVPAIIAAAATCAAGAVIWAGIAIATHSMFWLLAIGIGAVIGFVTAKAAGKGGRFVQVVSVLATMVSVLLGNVLLYGYQVNQAATEEGGHVDWFAFATYIPQILVESGSDTLFALGGGLFGAYYAARVTGRQRFDVNVE